MSPPQGKKRSPSPPSRRHKVARQEPDRTHRTEDVRQPGLDGRLFPDRSARVVVRKLYVRNKMPSVEGARIPVNSRLCSTVPQQVYVVDAVSPSDHPRQQRRHLQVRIRSNLARHLSHARATSSANPAVEASAGRGTRPPDDNRFGSIFSGESAVAAGLVEGGGCPGSCTEQRSSCSPLLLQVWVDCAVQRRPLTVSSDSLGLFAVEGVGRAGRRVGQACDLRVADLEG
jgi:hypothetical protein